MALTTLDTDVLILGAGTAGMTAYRAARKHADRVLLVEAHAYGTTCARVGCMPSKLLIAAGEVAHAMKTAPTFGVHPGDWRIDGRAVMDRVRRERDRFVAGTVASVLDWPEADRLMGHARFEDAHTVRVGDHTRVKASRIIIATGSRPAVPDGWREALGDRLIVNDDVFGWTDLPSSVAVVGAGAIGLELAQALHRLGVRVRLYARDGHVGPLTDPALSALAAEVFGRELPISPDARDLQVRREGDAVVVRHREGVDPDWQEERFDWLLAATGRRPNIDDLGLETTGLPLDARGVPVFNRRTAQIGQSRVFIAGDASTALPLLHEAADDGRIAGDNAGRFPDVRVRPLRAPLAVVFSEPQIALIGQHHAQLVAQGVDFETGSVSFEKQGRSRVMGVNQGALRVYGCKASGRFLGAEILGPAAEHMGHLLSWSVQRGDTVQAMVDSPFYHPVIEEGLRTALRELQRALRMGPPPVEHCLDCGPGA